MNRAFKSDKEKLSSSFIILSFSIENIHKSVLKIIDSV